MAVAVSGIRIGTQCFGTQVRDRDGTRCASIIVLKLIGNSNKGKKKKNHLKFIFSVESMLPILSIHCSVLHYERIATIGLPYVPLNCSSLYRHHHLQLFLPPKFSSKPQDRDISFPGSPTHSSTNEVHVVTCDSCQSAHVDVVSDSSKGVQVVLHGGAQALVDYVNCECHIAWGWGCSESESIVYAIGCERRGYCCKRGCWRSGYQCIWGWPQYLAHDQLVQFLGRLALVAALVARFIWSSSWEQFYCSSVLSLFPLHLKLFMVLYFHFEYQPIMFSLFFFIFL